MYLAGMITECDFTDKQYDAMVPGIHCLARGATGRVCCVMYMGLEYAKEHNIEASSRGDCEVWALDHPNGSVDF